MVFINWHSVDPQSILKDSSCVPLYPASRFPPLSPTLQYSTVQYSTVQYSTEQYSTAQYSTVQYSTLQYSTVSAVQCSEVRRSAAQCSAMIVLDNISLKVSNYCLHKVDEGHWIQYSQWNHSMGNIKIYTDIVWIFYLKKMGQDHELHFSQWCNSIKNIKVNKCHSIHFCASSNRFRGINISQFLPSTGR